MSGDRVPIELARVAPFRLGSIEARPATREVLGRGEREVLQPRIMQVLVALARAAGEVVSRDDLIRTCWDGQVVGDDAIQRCIAKLRQVGEKHAAFTIENIARVGYRLKPTPEQVSPIEGAAAAEGLTPVLAVLPFENLSSDPELQFFSDGVSEEILTCVARIAGLRVIGSTSSFAFRGERKVDAARALNASHVLDGSVRRGGARVRIGLQLTEAASGCVVWSERYDRELADVLALQDDIAVATASALSARLAAQTPKPQLDPQAYDLYLRALTVRRTPDPWAQEKAISYFEGALAIEPNFTRPRAGLAFALCKRIRDATTLGAPPELFDNAVARVRIEAERALAADADAPEARFALIALEPAIGNWETQEINLRAAIATAPNDGALATCLARILMAVGRVRDACTLAATAFRHDPLSPHCMVHEGLRRVIIQGDAAAARELHDRAMAAAPADELVWRARIALLTMIGDWDAVADSHPATPPDFGLTPARMVLGQTHLAAMQNKPNVDMEAYFRESTAFARDAPFAVFAIVFSYANLGWIDQAFDLIDDAIEIHPPHKLWSQWSIETINIAGSAVFFIGPPALRAHSRFLPLCARIGLCDYWVRTGLWPDFIVDAENRAHLEAQVRGLAT